MLRCGAARDGEAGVTARAVVAARGDPVGLTSFGGVGQRRAFAGQQRDFARRQVSTHLVDGSHAVRIGHAHRDLSRLRAVCGLLRVQCSRRCLAAGHTGHSERATPAVVGHPCGSGLRLVEPPPEFHIVLGDPAAVADVSADQIVSIRADADPLALWHFGHGDLNAGCVLAGIAAHARFDAGDDTLAREGWRLDGQGEQRSCEDRGC